MCGKDINGGDYENASYEDNSESTPVTGRIYRNCQSSQFDTEEEKEAFWKRFQHPGDRY